MLFHVIPRSCSVKECSRRHYARGWCSMHYKRWLSKGSIAGRTPGIPHNATWFSWKGMLERCRLPTSNHYYLYGGRGITVCERWKTFTNFLADMGERPADRTLDRIDNDGNYEPWNCRWATRKEQQSNRRVAKRLAVRNERHPAAVCCTPADALEWAELVKDDPDLSGKALSHWREVTDALE